MNLKKLIGVCINTISMQTVFMLQIQTLVIEMLSHSRHLIQIDLMYGNKLSFFLTQFFFISLIMYLAFQVYLGKLSDTLTDLCSFYSLLHTFDLYLN